MSKVFITGHKGFIGSHLTKELTDRGYSWVGYDLKDNNDIRDEITLDMKMREAQGGVVIHLAALAGVRDGEKRPEEYLHTNVVGTQNVINSAKRYDIKHFINFSSSSVLGNTVPPETGNIETEPMNPIAVYGISKMCAEHLVAHATVDAPFHASIIRPFTVYGENGRPNQVIYKWINCIKDGRPIPFFGDGTTKRGYTYVGDLVDGVCKLVDKTNEFQLMSHKYQVYNMGGSQIISLNDLYELFKKVVGEIEVERLELPNGDVPQNWADVTKATNAFAFNPATDFFTKTEEIIRKELSI